MSETKEYSPIPTAENVEEGIKSSPSSVNEPLNGVKGSSKMSDDIVCLKPKMSLLNGCTVIVGSIIGSGIFVSPKGVLKSTGSVGLSLVVWVACGIYSLIGAYCFAELGCMITKSGADYAYIMESFGSFMGFLRLWVECIIVRPCSQAIVARTFAIYILKPLFPDCDPPEAATGYLAVVCIGLLTFVNCWDVKWSTRVQDFFTYGKLLALAFIIGTGIYQISLGHTEHYNFDNSETKITKIAASFYSGLFAYNGWNYLNFVIEELKEPHKNLPKAIYISCILVTVVYTMTIVAFHSTLSVPELLASNAVAVTYAEKVSSLLAYTMPVFVAMSTFGGVNGILFTSSRLFYSGAEYNQMPQLLSMIQVKHHTPVPAVIAMCLLSLVYLLFKDIYALMDYVGFSTWLAIGLAVVCVPYLRWKRPDLARPIKVPLFYPILYIAATVFIIVVPIIEDPVSTGFGLIMILSGVPVYLLFIAWKNKPLFFQRFIYQITITLQKLFVVVPSEKAQDM
ncbi:Y+L amino acid transporter 2 [Tetranychus urticae]|uniref:Amino acid permease/ SLC12A domain-containing protein n=1 Tax=Tetranychus urticae TaxID=32264 RepID=T1KBY6_TETUR|nr:Y+L amino acid transporter 2 [Tetranychus urticae]